MDKLVRFFMGSPEKEGYWIGPYDMYVPNGVECVMDKGGRNTISKNGQAGICIEIGICESMTKEEYLAAYAELVDGEYYLKENIESVSSEESDKEDGWGPAADLDIRVGDY